MNQILEIMEDIKQNITDKQYKTIMDSLKDIYENKKNSISVSLSRHNIIRLMDWLDYNLILLPENRDLHRIKKKELYKKIIQDLYNGQYYDNIDFVKKVVDIYFQDKDKEIHIADWNGEYEFIRFRERTDD